MIVIAWTGLMLCRQGVAKLLQCQVTGEISLSTMWVTLGGARFLHQKELSSRFSLRIM